MASGMRFNVVATALLLLGIDGPYFRQLFRRRCGNSSAIELLVSILKGQQQHSLNSRKSDVLTFAATLLVSNGGGNSMQGAAKMQASSW